MLERMVAEQCREARREGRSLLAVCFDTFDRLRGDKDLGYYCAAFDSPAELRIFLADRQTGQWEPGRLNDFCEVVIDLQDGDRHHVPAAWLEKNSA